MPFSESFPRTHLVAVAVTPDLNPVILDPFGTTPNYRIGLFINESIINADMNPELNYNSRGFNNYSAPGADRLRITTSLIKKI